MHLQYPQELLNSMDTVSSMLDYLIKLKKGFIVMLLRNVRPSQGHVNVTRYIVVDMRDNILFLRAVSGTYKGESFVLPRINCAPRTEDFPIPGFGRCQFTVRVCFAMTINKAQGQSVSGKLGLDFSYPCFSHGQIYVALSRKTNPKALFVLAESGKRKSKNLVFTEVINVSSADKYHTLTQENKIKPRSSTRLQKFRTWTRLIANMADSTASFRLRTESQLEAGL